MSTQADPPGLIGSWLAVVLVLTTTGAGLGCGSSQSPSAQSSSVAALPTGIPTASHPAASVRAVPPPPTSAQPASSATPVAEVSVLRFERELEIPVRSIGLGEKRVAALGDEPWIDGAG